jgi:guanylate kinase
MTDDQSHQKAGLLLVLSGPSGVGKDTVWKAARPCLPSFAKATTCTTRARRPGEEEGVHYFFVSDEEFNRMIAGHQFLEWAYVHDNRYGVPLASVLDRLNNGQDVVCVIDVQGARRIRALFPFALLVFLKPPPGRETDVLEQRIVGRGAADEAEVARRLETATWELGQTDFYDFEIINDEVAHAARQLCEIVAREKEKRGYGV